MHIRYHLVRWCRYVIPRKTKAGVSSSIPAWNRVSSMPAWAALGRPCLKIKNKKWAGTAVQC